MSLVEKILFHLSQPRLCLFKTIYFNFKVLPFSIARKLPIYIYGPVKFYWLKGEVYINTKKIYSGMIKLGRNNEFFNGVDHSAFISIGKNSKIIFEGPCAISNNYKLRVAEDAILTFGAYTFFGSSVRFVCTSKITIGRYSRCAYESQFVDTNSHFVLNESTHSVAPRKGEIVIGSYNWIGNRTSINKGAHTKDYTIICAGSLINKNYCSYEEECMMIGGWPAKVISSKLRRIFSTTKEIEIIRYFKENPDMKSYHLESSFEDNMEDIINWFENVM